MTTKDYAKMIYDESFNMKEFMVIYISKNYSNTVDGYELSNFSLNCYGYKSQEDAGCIELEKY